VEVQLPKTLGVKEDLHSLGDLIKIIKGGSTWISGLAEQGQVEVVVEEVKKAISRRAK